MGAESDQKGTIRLVDWVDVNPQRQHPFQKVEGRDDMMQALLQRPWAEAVNVMTLFDTDGTVLMPAQGPIVVVGLVERKDPDGLHGAPQVRRCYRADDSVLAQLGREPAELCQPTTRFTLQVKEFGERRDQLASDSSFEKGPVLGKQETRHPSRSASHSSSHLIE